MYQDYIMRMVQQFSGFLVRVLRLRKEGKTEEAVTTLRRGLEVDANSPEGYTILGMVLLRLDRPDEAEKCAREALLRNRGKCSAARDLAASPVGESCL